MGTCFSQDLPLTYLSLWSSHQFFIFNIPTYPTTSSIHSILTFLPSSLIQVCALRLFWYAPLFSLCRWPAHFNLIISIYLTISGNFYNWLVGMLLVSRSGLVEQDAVKVFHYYGFHLSSSFLMYNFKSFQGNNNVVVFPFPFQIFMQLANLWFIRLQG